MLLSVSIEQQLLIILKGCAHVMLELYLLVIVGSRGEGKGISYSLGILHHNRVGGDFIKLSACQSSPLLSSQYRNWKTGEIDKLYGHSLPLCIFSILKRAVI